MRHHGAMGTRRSATVRTPRCAQCGAALPVPKNARRRTARGPAETLCAPCRRLADDAMWQRTCEAKNAYPSAAEAARAAAWADPAAVSRLRTYPCPYGDHFHLTSR